MSSQNHKWSMTVSPNFPSPPVTPSSLHPDPSHPIITVLNLVTSYHQKWRHRLQSWITLWVVVHFQIKFDVNLEAWTESNFSYTGVCDITEPEVTYTCLPQLPLPLPSHLSFQPFSHPRSSRPSLTITTFPNPVTSYNRKWRHHWETWITAWVVVYLHIQSQARGTSCTCYLGHTHKI